MVREADIDSVNDLVEDLQISEMKDLILEVRPSPLKSLIKGIVSKIPLGIPINPISIGLDIKKLKKERLISKKYGWIYFLIDLEKK